MTPFKIPFQEMAAVRIGDPEWSEKDARVLDTLLEKMQGWAKSCEGMTMAQILEENYDPRIRVGKCHAYILYGQTPLYEEHGQLKVSAKGIVYEPICKRRGRTVRLELGDDGCL